MKQLNKEQINEANRNSISGTRGNTIKKDYETYCNSVKSWNLSPQKTEKIIEKIYNRFSMILNENAKFVSVAVAGTSNYNSKKYDNSEKILKSSYDFVKWFEDLEEQATAQRKTRVQVLKDKIRWGVEGEYATSKEWKELAGRNRKEFEELYRNMNTNNYFSKSSTPYKIYHNIIKIEPIYQAPLFSNDDYYAYIELEKICVVFRMKPAQQLIRALKSKGFYWDNSNYMWKAKETEERKQWVCTLCQDYKEYI